MSCRQCGRQRPSDLESVIPVQTVGVHRTWLDIWMKTSENSSLKILYSTLFFMRWRITGDQIEKFVNVTSQGPDDFCNSGISWKSKRVYSFTVLKPLKVTKQISMEGSLVDILEKRKWLGSFMSISTGKVSGKISRTGTGPVLPVPGGKPRPRRDKPP